MGLFGILLSSFLSYLYIVDINPLSNVGLVKIFSHPVVCCFVLLNMSFALQKLFCFMRTHLSVLCSEISVPKSSKATLHSLFCQVQCSRRYAEVFDPYEVEFGKGGKGVICIHLNSPIKFDQRRLLKMLSFFLCVFLTSHQRLGVHGCVDLCVCLQIRPISQRVCFCANTMCCYTIV